MGRIDGRRRREGGGGARGSRDHRRRRAARRRLEIDCLAGAWRKLAGRRVDARARLRRDDGTRLHLSSRRGDLARREVRRDRHGHQRPVEPLLRRTRDRHRAGLPGRRLYPVPRQHRGESGPPAAGDPVDARARRRWAGACAGDRLVAERVEGPRRRHAGRPGDAPSSRAQGVDRLAGEQGGSAQSDSAPHSGWTQADRVRRRHDVDGRSRGTSRRLSPCSGRGAEFRSRHRWSSRR